jgi:tetratricopeptide (TPR) repeat protein
VENWKSGFFGSGLGTWSYEFSKFKPVDFNKTIFWQIRYDRPGSHFSEILGTMGFFGFFSYLFLVGLFFLISWFLAKKIEFLPFFFTFLAIFFSQIFYYQNISLAFLFWLFLGLTISSSKSLKEKSFSFKDLPELSLVFSTIFILLFFLILTTYFFAFRFYLADQNYSRAQFVSSTQDKIRLLEKAVNLNQRLINYRLILARTYLLQIFEETAKPLAEQDSNKIQNSMARAIDQAKRATEISPNSVLGWETLGMIYRDIQPLAAGATDWAIKSFEKAIKLEPKNPVLYTELGKIYLATDLQKSKEYFSKAKELKPDYLDALIQDALVFEREKNLDEAIKRMEEVVKSYPFSIEARFQLGRLYFNSGKLDEAISQFEQVISIFPNHSNSLYSLGLAYAKKGEKEKAISYLEKVLKLNPGNKEIIQKLEELKK